MKKYKLKTRMQWGWFKAALMGIGIGILIAPVAKNGSDASLMGNISFGPKVKVMMNGEVVALAKSEKEGEAAFKTARLAYNADGIKILSVDVSFEEVDKDRDADVIKEMKVLKDQALSDEILKKMDDYADPAKELAYTMRIDDYTVTVDSMENLVSVLEQTQGQYDTEDRFQVDLVAPASRNVTVYEVGVTEKAAAPSSEETEETAVENSESAESGNMEEVPAKSPASENPDENIDENGNEESSKTPPNENSETPMEEDLQEGGVTMLPPTRVGLTGENTDEQSASGETQNEEEDSQTNEENSEEEPSAEENLDEQSKNDEAVAEENPQVAAQAANDGVKYIGFSEKIEVMQTYVDKGQIKDKETAYSELTQKSDTPSIYVVKPGDCLSIIAEKNNMTEEQIKELNPGIESDENLYYDDRLNITVPTAPVQVLVQKQETYEEKYSEDVIYEDDADMYIGETEVVQEGLEGTHIVTDLVTYKDDIESGREQIEENVEVAAVAGIVKRGTKSKPTYIYPVTNWNVTSNFGYRWGRLHAGTDVGVPVGTTVRASRAGQVVTAGWVGGYGNCVMIDHGDGVWTVYGHLSEIDTSVGNYVDQGQQIALSGNTGRSTGPHLHFEIRVNGSATDATPYLEGTAN